MSTIRALLLPLLLASVSTALAGDPPLSTELVATGFQLPVFATAPAGDPRLFVLEQNSGRIELVKAGVIQTQPFLDVSAKLLAGGERGLLGLAFHPDYAVNGRLFVTYNNLSGAVVLERYLVDPRDLDRAQPESGELLLTLPKPFPQHNAGMLAFGPTNGLLHMSTGDGGGSGDPFDNAQDLSSLLGKLLRIDVDGAFPYAVPPGNPFVGVPGAAGEIFAYGLRNPWRFSVDRQTGALFIGDVGQQLLEEVDYIRPDSPGGQNFGWRCAEGTVCTELGTCTCPVPAVVPPLYEYDHNDGCAIIGGYMYRGSAVAGLEGTYLFGDYCTSKVWSFRLSSGTVVDFQDRTTELTPAGGSLGFITSFGEDGDGELLIVGYLGDVRRVVSAPLIADCDEDGVPDAEEIAQGTAMDVNLDGVPDACQLLLTSSALIKGRPATLTFIGAAPGQVVAWMGSTRGIGQGPCYFGGSLCLDLLPFNTGGPVPEVFLMGLSLANAQGQAQFGFTVPVLDPSIKELAFQTVAVAGAFSSKSNPVQKVLQDN